MIIDAHVHLTKDKLDPEVIELAEKQDIKLCVSSLGRVWSENPAVEQFKEGNRDVWKAMKQYPDRVLGYAYVNPVYEKEALKEFERCIVDFGMVGLKLWVSCHANESRVFPLIEKAIELKVPLLQHAWHKITGNLPRESDPLEVAELAKRYPEATIIMAHIGGDWEYGIKAVKKYPNVLVDTSGSVIDMGMMERAVSELGAERIIFGTDLPGADWWATYGKVVGAEIPEEAKELILCGNMARVLGRKM